MFELKITATDANDFRDKLDKLFGAFVRVTPVESRQGGAAEAEATNPESVDPPVQPRGRGRPRKPPETIEGAATEVKPEAKEAQVDIEEAIAAKTFDREEVRAVLIAWMNIKRQAADGDPNLARDAVAKMLAGLGVAKFPDLSNERLGDLVAAIEADLGPGFKVVGKEIVPEAA